MSATINCSVTKSGLYYVIVHVNNTPIDADVNFKVEYTTLNENGSSDNLNPSEGDSSPKQEQ